MEEQKDGVEVVVEELPDEWWHRVYVAVMITTVAVIAALWGFTRYFS